MRPAVVPVVRTAPAVALAVPARRDLLLPYVGKLVDVTTVDGKSLRGELREVGTYELAIVQPGGVVVVMKGAVVTVALGGRG